MATSRVVSASLQGDVRLPRASTSDISISRKDAGHLKFDSDGNIFFVEINFELVLIHNIRVVEMTHGSVFKLNFNYCKNKDAFSYTVQILLLFLCSLY